jgi:hypothetical protein
MARMVKLYAWVVPAFSSGSPVDHTWVTTYDNRQIVYPNDSQVTQAGESYWYCWGGFCPSGGTPNNQTGYLGEQSGDLSVAQCLVKPNADSRTDAAARGTIFTYGVDGVCHQLANQILYATAIGSTSPLTVRNARGYIASTFIYHTYGLQHAAWANKIASCGAPSSPLVAAKGAMAMPGLPDDFEKRAREVLGDENPKLLADLLTLRSETTRFAAQKWPGFTPPNAATLNARNQYLLEQAARLLDREKFIAIFGFEPGQKIDLVDPNIQEGQQ